MRAHSCARQATKSDMIRKICSYFYSHLLETVVSGVYCVIIPCVHSHIVEYVAEMEARSIVILYYLFMGMLLGALLCLWGSQKIHAQEKDMQKQEKEQQARRIADLERQLADRPVPFGDTGFKTDHTGLLLCPHCLSSDRRSYLRRDEKNRRYHCRECDTSQWDDKNALTQYYCGRNADEKDPHEEDW